MAEVIEYKVKCQELKKTNIKFVKNIIIMNNRKVYS